MLPQRGNIGRQPQAGAGRTPALTAQPEKSLPSLPAPASLPLPSPPFRRCGLCLPPQPAAAAKPQGETGGRGGNYFPRICLSCLYTSDAGVPQPPVCARHAVRCAELARRPLRLTPEVNSGYLRPSAGPLESGPGPQSVGKRLRGSSQCVERPRKKAPTLFLNVESRPLSAPRPFPPP